MGMPWRRVRSRHCSRRRGLCVAQRLFRSSARCWTVGLRVTGVTVRSFRHARLDAVADPRPPCRITCAVSGSASRLRPPWARRAEICCPSHGWGWPLGMRRSNALRERSGLRWLVLPIIGDGGRLVGAAMSHRMQLGLLHVRGRGQSASRAIAAACSAASDSNGRGEGGPPAFVGNFGVVAVEAACGG